MDITSHAAGCTDTATDHPMCTGPEHVEHGVSTWRVSDKDGHRLYLDAPGVQLGHTALGDVIDRLRAEHEHLASVS